MSDFELMRRKSDKALVRVYSKDDDNEGCYWHCSVDIGSVWRLLTFKPDQLEPIPQKHKRTVWLNVYGSDSVGSYAHKTRKHADDDAKSLGGRTACLQVNLEFEEGEGL